ncbi:hypothetical protein O3P69_012178 [Scylla paramamosain]|uniref:Uncharacterized protein n=1 Tax=Scylla paramamosain TaxID=85552 RepID=A0AAW0TCB1_SCYPA
MITLIKHIYPTVSSQSQVKCGGVIQAPLDTRQEGWPLPLPVVWCYLLPLLPDSLSWNNLYSSHKYLTLSCTDTCHLPAWPA